MNVWSLLGDRRRDIGTSRIDVQRTGFGDDDEIHIFHRNGANQDLVAHHQSAREADAVLESHLDRADVGHAFPGAVGEGHLLLVDGIELQPIVISRFWNYSLSSRRRNP